MKNLSLTEPLVFIDLETTGLGISTDRIVEISLLKVNPDSKEELITELINPEMPIPEEATAIHGIKDNDVRDKPLFKQRAQVIADFIVDCDMAGFNIKRFDLPMLEAEFRRANIEFSRKNRSILDIQVIYHKYERRDLEAAYHKYCGKRLEGNHRSKADVKAVLEILDEQVLLYKDLPKDACGIHEFCCEPGESNWIDSGGRFFLLDGEIAFNFGKYRNKYLKDIVKDDPDYLNWVLHNPSFPLEVQEIVLKTLNE